MSGVEAIPIKLISKSAKYSQTLPKIEKKLMHYMGKAISDFKMIEKGDRVLVCLSGGKDSFTLLTLLNLARIKANYSFDIFVFMLDQSQPGWDATTVEQYLCANKLPYEILTKNTYKIVTEKIPENKTYCSLCSRLRRGIIYRYAEEKGFNKIALGHHRDDLIATLMMSILYSGEIRSMPPKLLSDNKKNIIIRPLSYCQEKDIQKYAELKKFPIIPCNLCGSQPNLKRATVARLIHKLAEENPKVPSNMLHAISHISPSQLMDKRWWDFDGLIPNRAHTELNEP